MQRSWPLTWTARGAADELADIDRMKQCVLGDVWPSQFADDSASVEYQHAIADLGELLQIGAVKQDDAARLRLLDDNPVDFRLGAYVNPTSWVVEKQDARIGLKPFPKRKLLLIAS